MSFIFRWKPSVMPLLRVKRHMRTISSVHSESDLARVRADSMPTGLFGELLQAEQSTQPFFHGMDGLECWMQAEELGELLLFNRIEAILSGAQQAQPRALPAQIRAELPGDPEEMKASQADRVEAIRHDRGPGKPTPDHRAIGVGEIDADHFDFLPAAQRPQIRGELGFASALADIKHAVPLEIAEGRGEALALMQGVLVDAEDLRAVQAKPLAGFALGKLSVNATDRGWAHSLLLTQGRGADAIMMALKDDLAPRLRTAPARQDAGQGLNETHLAGEALVTPAFNQHLAGVTKAVEVAHPTFIPALTVQAAACTVRA